MRGRYTCCLQSFFEVQSSLLYQKTLCLQKLPPQFIIIVVRLLASGFQGVYHAQLPVTSNKIFHMLKLGPRLSSQPCLMSCLAPSWTRPYKSSGKSLQALKEAACGLMDRNDPARLCKHLLLIEAGH